MASRRYGLDRDANFEGEWHLHMVESIDAVAAALGQSAQAVAALIESARTKLLKVRDLRVWPARDDKVLTAWNALMIKGLAIAARVLHRPDLADAAASAVDFIRHTLWREGRLLATAKDGRAHLPAYLDDYAFLADALLELLQTRWRSSDLEFARQLTDVLLSQFEDAEAGGFYFTAADHERLIHRSKSFSDDSVPSGNGVAAAVLCRLGYLLGELPYLDAAERTLRAGWSELEQYPQAHMSMVNALEDFLGPMQIVIIRGDAAQAEHWAEGLARRLCAEAPDIRHSARCRGAAAGARRQARAPGHRGLSVHRHDLLRPAFRPGRDCARTAMKNLEDNPALQAIWHEVCRIPRGQVSTYGAVARSAGFPGRARQAGFALRVAPKSPESALASRGRRGRPHRVSPGIA